MAKSRKRRKSRRNRANTIQALIAKNLYGCPDILAAVDGELNQLVAAEKVPDLSRRTLLQVLHATRALDSTLDKYLTLRRCKCDGKSLGAYLTALTNSGLDGTYRLSENRRKQYQNSIVDPRNRYMHQAGAFPKSDQELNTLLSEMEACLADVFRL